MAGRRVAAGHPGAALRFGLELRSILRGYTTAVIGLAQFAMEATRLRVLPSRKCSS